MNKLKAIVSVLVFCFPLNRVVAKNADFIGITEYKKYQIVISQIDGIIEALPINAGQQLAPSQHLFSIKPFDPLLQKQESYAPKQALQVIQLFAKEGKNVSRYQPVAKLGQQHDVHVVTKSYTLQEGIKLGASVSILLDPDGLSVEVPGKITAYEPFSEALLSGYQVEVSLDMARCVVDQSCRAILKPGVLAQITLNKQTIAQ